MSCRSPSGVAVSLALLYRFLEDLCHTSTKFEDGMKEIEVDHFGLHIGRLSCGVSREAVDQDIFVRAKIGNGPSPMRRLEHRLAILWHSASLSYFMLVPESKSSLSRYKVISSRFASIRLFEAPLQVRHGA